MTLSTVTVQTTPESRPAIPNWMGEVAAFAQLLKQTGMLTSIASRARFPIDGIELPPPFAAPQSGLVIFLGSGFFPAFKNAE